MGSTKQRSTMTEMAQAEGAAVPPEEMQRILDSAPTVNLNETEAIAEPLKPLQRIYCGPNLPKGVLLQHAVVIGELPKHLSVHIEKCPAIQRLFVPVEQLPETQRSIQEAGTPEHIFYGQISSYIAGGVSE